MRQLGGGRIEHMLWNQMVLGINSQSATNNDITFGKLLQAFEFVSLSINQGLLHLSQSYLKVK